MAGDCGIELKPFGITMLSLYPGAVKTEVIQHLSSKPESANKKADIGGVNFDTYNIYENFYS
jgi:hypothetical protein